jgi:hypothetical protein
MPGLVPGIHALRHCQWQDVDGRDKPGYDDLCYHELSRIAFMDAPTTPPAPPLYRRILLAVLGAETLILFGYIAVAQIFHLDPTGDTYWKDTTIIALGVFFILVAPALLLTWLGGYALVIATPLAAFAAFMCSTPYIGIMFDWPPQIWFGFLGLLALCAAAVVQYEKRRASPVTPPRSDL